MPSVSCNDLEQLLYLHSDDFGYLNKDQIKDMYDLEVPVTLHVEDFLDFYYFDLVQNRLKQLLEDYDGNLCR